MRTADPELLRREHDLAKYVRSAARDRLALGEVLLALQRSGGHHELGFSSLEAYALERCERGPRWARTTRSLARALDDKRLRAVRGALRTGVIGWSMAELLVRHATVETEAALVDAARLRTLAEMKRTLSGPAASDAPPEEEDVPLRTAVRSVSAAELRLLEATRMLTELLDGRAPSDESFVNALLGEAESTLAGLGGRFIAEVPAAELSADVLAALDAAQAVRCGARAPATSASLLPLEALDDEDPPLPSTPRALDARARELQRRLAARDLEIGQRSARVFRRVRWRALGFSSAAAYCRERLGCSLSSIEHRMRLARRSAQLPGLGAALHAGEIGYEAALLVARVATRATVGAWIDRARRRTLVHLREEVQAVRVDRVFEDDGSPWGPAPPDDALLERVREIERSVQDGSFLDTILHPFALGPQTSVTLRAGTGEFARFRITEDLAEDFRTLERRFRAAAGHHASFVAFLCFSLWGAWQPLLREHHVAWDDIYRRDRYRCTSPVCSRHDVTPHHLRFKSHGGGDEPDNLTSLCSWCHLYGLHEGRLSAEPPASNIRWTIGREAILTIQGRERIQN